MKYLQFIKQDMQSYLAYRFRVIIWILVDSISFVVFPFIWLAVYGDRAMLSSYTKVDIITYYILIAFLSLTIRSHLNNHVKEDIIKGILNNYLVKPVRYILTMFLHETSYKIFSLMFVLPLMIIIYLFFNQYIVFPGSAAQVFLFLISLTLSFILSIFIELILGFSSFWLGENSGPQQFNFILESVFSGRLAPLVFFPAFLQSMANYFPYKYIFYFPIQIYLGQIQGLDILFGFLITIAWIIFLWGIVILMWKRGLRKYEGVGI